MGQLKHLTKHLWMCAPMIVIAVVLVASGVGIAALLPVVACVLMMTVMMAAMRAHSGSHDSRG